MKTLALHYPMIQFLIKYNIPQVGGIETVCSAVENFYGDDTPIPTLSLKYTEPPWAQRWPSQIPQLNTKLDNLNCELEKIIEYRTKGAIMRSRIRWHNEGEKKYEIFLES